MSLLNIELQAILKDGSIKTLALANSAPTPVASPAAQLPLPLSVKAEEGAQYKLIDLTSGSHLKGQRLLRHQKNLRVFIEDAQALELQDYFVASLVPVENAPVYRLENQSCDEVQVISHYPEETFELQESNVWTEGDSALDCKVALLNPGSMAALLPSSSVVASGIGFSEISAAVIGIPLLLGGGNSDSTPTQPPTPPPPPPPPSDTTAPTVTISSNVDSLKAGETAIITFTFSEDIGDSFNWDGTTGDLTISGGTLSEISGSGLTRTAIFTPTANASGQTAKITVNDQSYQDTAGNKGAGNSSPELAVDTHLPTIRSVQISHDAGGIDRHLNEGDTLFAALTFDEPITVQLANGEPTLSLVIGNQSVLARYVSGTGTATLIFKTTILAGQTDVDGVSIANNGLALNGSVLISGAGNSVSLTFDKSNVQPSFVVDTTAPNLVISSNQLSLKSNETALVTLTFSEAIDNSQFPLFDINNLIVSGGTLGDLSGNGLIRTAIFTPTPNISSGTASITVTAASYQDLAGNSGSTGSSPSITIDTLSPLVSITSDVSTLKLGETAAITFTFSEDPDSSFVWDGVVGDITVTGGTLGAISGYGLTRTAVFTPTANLASGNASITVTAASYQDTAGNSGYAGTSPTITIDTLSPSVTISSDVTTLKTGETANITFTFTEDPGSSFRWNGSTGDVFVAGGTLSAIIGSGLTRTGTFTPTPNSTSSNISITVTAESYQDAIGNPGSANNSPTISFDTLAPTITITSDLSRLKSGETTDITFTFSENPGSTFAWDGSAGDIAVTGGTLGAISGTGLTRTAVFTPTANLASGNASITVFANSYQDSAGNNGTAGSTLAISIDTLAPTATITSDVSTLKSGDTAAITFTFSEDPGSSFAWNGIAGDITVTGGTLGAISGSGLTRTAVFTPTMNLASGNASITVIANSYQDAAGNLGSAGTTPIIRIDTFAPTVRIGSNVSTLKAGETAHITFTFSEDLGSTFAWDGSTGDITVTGGTLGAISGIGLIRTGTFTPTANLASGNASITVASNAYQDAAGNPGGAGTTPSINIDTLAPTVSIASNVSTLKASETAHITFTFSEDPGSTFAWDGSTGDITVTGGTLGAISGSGLTRTGTFTPTPNLGSGTASITVTAASYQDAASNTGSAGTSLSVYIDTLSPSVTISSDVSALKAGETAAITFTFSENPGSSFTWNGTTGAILVSGGTLSAINGTGLTRTALFTPTANLASGTASITVAAASYQDAAGNPGSEGTTPSISIDTLAPTVSITSNATTLKAGETANITFTFSEDPSSSFEWNGSAGDITVTGGTLGAISGTGFTRTAVFTPTANLASGNASITVSANSYQDSAGNNGPASSTPAISIDTLAPNVSISSNVTALKVGETANITFTFSEDPGGSFVWDGSTGDVVVTGGTLGAISGTGLARTAVFTPTSNLANGNASITVTANSYQDAPGNNGSAGTSPSISIDTLAPTVSSVILSGANGDQNQRLNAGDTLSATLTFNEVVTLNTTGGAPTLALLIGSSTVQATYVSGSGSNALVFTTTIVNGQTDTDGVAIALNPLSLNGATLQDNSNNSTVNGTAAVLSNSNYLVDTTAPTVTVASNVSALKAGETATITFTFSEDPSTSFAWDGSAGDVLVSGGTLSAISGSGTTRTAVFTPTANLASGPGTVTVTVNSYQDSAGNIGGSAVSSNITLDTLVPNISSLALSSATGAVASPLDASVKLLNATDTLSATVTFSEAVTLNTTAGSPTLALVVGNSTVQATYVSGSGTSNLVFSTTVISGQNDTDGVAIALNAFNLNGATLKDTAGNTSAITSIAVANNALYLVDTTAPSLMIGSDVATLKAGETAIITFTFSEDPGSSFVWASNAGDVVVSGGTLGNISGSGVTRTASFTPTANVVAGTASITVNAGTYTDAAGNTGGAGTTPSLTYSTTTPTVSQVGLTSATGAVNNLLNTGDVILARVVFSEAIVLNSTLGSPTLGLTIGSTLVQAAYVSGNGTTDFVFGYTILAGQDDTNGIAIPSAALTLNGSTLKSVAGNSVTLGNASVADNFLYPVDTTAPSVVITSSATSLKSGETSLICFTFSEDPDTSFSLADVTVTGGTLSALTGLGTVRRSTFTPTPNLANGTASITVADLSYTDAAGNLGTAGTTPSISIDTLAPSISNVALSGSTGKVNNTLNAGDTLSVTATFNDTVILNTDGGVPTFKLSIGANTVYAAYVSGSGTNALLFTTTIVVGQTDTDGVAIPANALLLNGATLKDANGNTSSIGLLAVTSNAAFMVDTIGPTVAITSDNSSLTVGATANITFTFSEDPDTSFAWDGTSGDLAVSGGTLSAISGTGLTRTAVFTPTTNQGSGTASITVTGNSYQDTAGNNGAAGTTPTLNLDTLAPTITSLALTSSTGGLVSASDATINNLNAGDTLSATVTFNDVITVNTSGGTPYLALNVGGTSVQAAYVSGSGSNALVFTATVASGHNDSNGVAIGVDALNLNGGTLKDSSGNNSTLTSIALTDNAHYLVDTTRPTAVVNSSTSALISGQTATITFTFSEDPGSSFVWNGTSGDLVVTGGTLSALSTTGNPLTRTALLTPTSGVSAGTANVAIALNSYTDAAGNIGQEASAGVTDKTADISVTTTTTTVASVTLLSATNIQNSLLNQGDVVSVAVNFTEAVFINANAGTPSLGLTIGSTVVNAQYASGAGTAQLVFNYTILNDQTDVNGIAINPNSLSLNGKVLTDTAGNTPTLTFTAVGDNANYLVDTTAPTLVSISSSKGVFLSGETAVITFTFSEDPGSTFTWDGNAGDVTLVNGTLSALTGIGLTRSATFLPTQGLSGGNATITVSNNLYTDSAGNLGTGNTLDGLLLNTTPATLMDVQISSATGVQNNALNAGDVVTVTAHFSEAQTLNTTSGSPTVALQIGSSTVNATYASGAGTDNLLFTYTIQAGQTDANGIAIGANALSLNGSTLQDPRANTTTLVAPGTADNSSFTVDTTAPFLSITSNLGQLKSGETANINFTFSEDPGNTFVWDGSTGDITLNNGTLSAISGTGTTRTAVFTPTPSLNTGTANIAVSSGAYQDAAGNIGSAGGTPSLTIDTLAPTISTVALSGSTGILNTYLNENDTANVSVTFTEVVHLNLTGGSPTLALLLGSSTVQATYVSGTGSNTLVFTTTIAAGQNDADGIAIALNALSLNGAVLLDVAGNSASTSSAAVNSNSVYMVDTLAPSVLLSFNVASLKAGETATLSITANDKTGTSFTWNGTAGDLTVSGGTVSAIGPFVLSGANYVSTATFTPTAGSTTAGVVSTASAVYTDLAGNPGQVGSSASVSIDTSVPTLTSMNITGASGILSNTLNEGDVVQITATFSEAVVVNTSGGSPKVSLNVGGLGDAAVYVSGSGTTDLLFNYTVVAGQNDANGLSYAANALVLNGGTIKDSAGNSAVITAIARADNAAYKVDTSAPTVTITSSRSQLLVGQTANITFTFSEDPGSTFTWDGSAGDVTLSNGTLSAVSGTGLTRTAIFTPTANFNSGNASIVVTAASYTDAAGNTGVIGTTPSITVDTLGIDISQIDYYTNTMTAIAGAKVGVWIQYPETAYFNTTGGLPTIDLIIGNTVVKATYSTNHMGWSGYYFLYTVLDGQNDTNGISYVANSLSLNGATIKDSSGNNAGLLHTGGSNGGVVVDTTHPTMEITSNKTTLKIGETATITFTASEAIQSIGNLLTPSNFTLTGGTLSNLIVASSQVATATFTPHNNQSQVNSSIILKAGAIQDGAYNISLVSNAAPAILIDTVAPTVSITMSRNIVSSVNTSLVTFTFSEDPGASFNWDGSVGDITITNGTLGAISGSGLTRTATLSAPANTSLWNTTLSVVANSYTDAFGNLGSAATSPLFSIDSATPKTNSRSIGSQGQLNSRVNVGDVVELTLFMDKTNMVLDTSGGFPTMAFTIGTTLVQASYFSHTTSTILFKYTILAGQTDTDGVTLNANGVSYNGSIYKDTYGNLASVVYPAWTVGSVLVDTTAPTLTITSSRNAILAGQTATITFTFSEDIGTSFVIGDIVATNGVLSSFTGTGAVWTATLTPTANFAGGTSSITVAANSYIDLAGNNGSAGITPVINIDTIVPTVAVTTTKTTFKAGDTANITFTFSEDPGTSFTWNGTSGDIIFSGGTLSAISGSGLTRTALFTPTANNSGNPIISVRSESYQDALGNLGTSGSVPFMMYDTAAPTVTATADSITLKAGQTTRVYFTFNEDPGTSFSWNGSVGDVLITGAGTLVPDNVPSHQIYAMRGFDFTPPANVSSGSTTISVKANSYQDTVGNLGAASGTITISYDTLAPTVSITSSTALVGMGQTATITFTFSEDPGSTFTWNGTTGDVVVTQGTLGAISGTGLIRTAVFTPFADTPLTAASITVTAGSYTDTATNAGQAGTSPTLNVNTFKNAIYLDDIANNIGGYAIESPNTTAKFGFAVSLAGDFNGDGYGDVVMGAPLNTFTDLGGTVRTEGGGVVLYEGGQNTSLVPKGYSGTGQVNGHYYTYSVTKGWLGFSVAGMGDMNNDGLADLLIGMPQDGLSSNPGGAFLVYGKANSSSGSLTEYQKDISALSTTPDALSITSTFDTAGFSVSSAGDVNGDGWTDMIISAHFQVVGSLAGNTGKSYVVYGGAALSSLQTISLGDVGGSVHGFVISGWQAGEESGTSVSSAGDINDDGLADLLVSAYYNDVAGTESGMTYVVLGKTGDTAVNLSSIKNNLGGFAIKGENAQDKSGVSVSSGGDINGDGIGDIIIGAIIAGTGNTYPASGRTYVVFGKTTANATIDLGQIASGIGGFAILSNITNEQSGHSVSSAGDINGDGLADIILGAPYSPIDGGANTGRSFVVYGKATTTNVNLSDVYNNVGGFAIVGQGAQDLSGYSVGAAGDINGDGLADLIVGSPGYDPAAGSTSSGRSYVIFGSKTGAFAAGSALDNTGTSANDTLTSTGGQTLAGGSFSAGTGNDTFIANGADVLLGGMGKDIFTVNASMITALQSNFGAGGNTSQLAKIDGGAGIDTLRMGGTGGLGFDFSLVSNTSVGNIEGASRINSIERIDLRTDTASNQITLRVADVLDMAGSNWANLNTLNTLGSGGWQNVGTGTSFSASGVKYHQVAIDGTSVDRVNTSGWTLQTTGTVRDANAVVYDVYLAASNAPAMMLVQQDMIRFSVP